MILPCYNYNHNYGVCLKDANGKANGSAPSALVAYFLGMGFSREMVFRAIKEIGNDNNNTIPHLLRLHFASFVSTVAVSFRGHRFGANS